jgi:hypothetical protein
MGEANIEFDITSDNVIEESSINMVDNITYPRPQRIQRHNVKERIWYGTGDSYSHKTISKLVSGILSTTTQYVHPLVFVNACLDIVNANSYITHHRFYLDTLHPLHCVFLPIF